MAFDVINFSHDVPQIGFSGKIRTGSTTTSIVLDREVVIEPSTTYKLQVQFGTDDIIEEKLVTSPQGTYPRGTPIACEAFSQVPQKYDSYSFGENAILVKPYRIVSLSRGGDYTCEITALEYDADIYTDGSLIQPIDHYSVLSLDVPPVTNLALTEGLVKLADGTIEDIIDVWFNKPILTSYKLKRYLKAKIYISDNAGVSYLFVGETDGAHFKIQGGIKDLSTYRIKVVSVTDKGEELSLASSPYANITVAGKTANPSNVTGFDANQQGNIIHFNWDAVSDIDLARYEIRKGSEWSTAQVIGERVDTTEFLYPVGEIGPVTFMIKAIDTSGNESLAPALDTLTVTPPPDMNFVNNVDLFSQNLEYILSGCSLVMGNLYNPAYNRKMIALSTATSWETNEGAYATWEAFETAGINFDGTVTSPGYFQMVTPIDLGIVFEFNLVSDLSYLDASGGATIAVHISTSEDGVTYSSFALIDAATHYRARYVRFKLILTASDTAYPLYLYAASLFINAPVTKVAWIRDKLISATGTAILWGVGFTSAPRVQLSIVNGVIGFPVASLKTADGCTVFVYDKDGLAINTAECDIEAKGY